MSHKKKILANMRRRTKKPDHVVYPREEFVKRRVFRRWKWIFTADDWCPNYNVFGEPDRDGDMVKVSLIHMGLYNQKTKEIDFTGWRVCVWGADDYGMEIDVETRQQGEMWFNRVVNFTSMDDLRAWGFVNA